MDGEALVKAILRTPLTRSGGVMMQGLSVQLGRSVARQLDTMMILYTETPAWWAAALPTTPAFTDAGNPQR